MFQLKSPSEILKSMVLCHQGFQRVFSFTIENGKHKEKCWVYSISGPQSHTALTMTLKSCQNLCSFKWLNPKRS